ncbi:MAG: tetratricopeptide repeat protein [Hyphomicrobiaceae bacterium]
MIRLDRPEWFQPHLVVMAVVFIGATLVGYWLLPDANERIAMLERDGHDMQALQMLEARFAAGDRKQRTLFQLQRLYEEQGDLPKARQMLVLLAAARPRDANVQRRLIEFYRSTEDEAGYIQALEVRLARRYSNPVCRELICI